MDPTMLHEHPNLSWLFTLIPMGLSLLLGTLFIRKKAKWTPALITGGVSLTFILTALLLVVGLPKSLGIIALSPLTLGMVTLTLFVSTIISHFSRRYLDGDKRIAPFFRNLGILTLALCMLNISNHIALLAASWIVSAACLSMLIAHRKGWRAARASARQTLASLLTGSILVTCGLVILGISAGSPLISDITSNSSILSPSALYSSLVLVAVGVAIQSGLYPFEKWLIGSVNAPTPVSALMHAGLINGGGVLLVKLSALLIQVPLVMALLLCLGLGSAIVSTFRKLLQPSIKSMLAHSTSAQMGFMIIQCSLGLFPAAITHLMWHGLFKAHLFLGSGNAAETPAPRPTTRPSAERTVLALVSATLGAWVFYTLSHPPLFSVGIVFLSGAQALMGMGELKGLSSRRITLIAGPLMGLTYGLTVTGVEQILGVGFPSFTAMPLLAGAAFTTLTLFWLAFHTPFLKWIQQKQIWKSLYARAYLNSLPKRQTWTLARGDHDS